MTRNMSTMNREKREPDYPPELETHFILRLPEEPAKQLRDVLKCGENLKNRLTIQIENDMRSGEVRFDHWLMNAKIVDLPTITESLKTIDNKSFYKCADICQMMICKLEPDQSPVDEEPPDKRKKKDPYKVDKKFLWPHGVTPPTKNARKRRFRKTLRKKCMETPEIEKEVKRLLRADNEAVSVTWEVIKEDEEHFHSKGQPNTSGTTVTIAKPEKKSKSEKAKWEKSLAATNKPSNVVDIFGGAVSDSEDEDNVNMEVEDSRLSAYDSRLSDTNSMQGVGDSEARPHLPIEFASEMFAAPQEFTLKAFSNQSLAETPVVFGQKSGDLLYEQDGNYLTQDISKDNMPPRIDRLRAELEELKQRKHRTQQEIAGMENLALRQRFQDTLHMLNQDIMYKEMEYQGLLVLQNSVDVSI